jgi:hypothetical protein
VSSNPKSHINWRTRFRLAFEILLGRAEIREGSQYQCLRAHPDGDEAIVKKQHLSALETANDELKVARGFICAATTKNYDATVEKTVRK